MCTRLYQENVYMTECDSTVVDLPAPGCVILDRTVFFPEGGGQPCDTGTLGGFNVDSVYEENGRIIHKLAADPSPAQAESLPQPGQTIRCRIDWDRRFDHMQRHCGEHILSGIFFRDYNGVNRGFHMGDSYMTIDIDLAEVTQAMLDHVEFEANKVIWANAPVTIRYFKKGEEASRLPLRKALAVDEDVTIVCVGSEQAPADCVACCGTHPDTAGQIGILKILKAESYKGMTRVYFEAGKRAYADYAEKHRLLTGLMERYSSDAASLVDKLGIQEAKAAAVRQELHRCKAALLDREADALLSAIAVPGEEGDQAAQLVVREYEDLRADDLQMLAKKICAASAHLFILVSLQDRTAILATGNAAPQGGFDCGMLVRTLAAPCGGKGGGSAAAARVSFEDLDGVESFIARVVGSL